MKAPSTSGIPAKRAGLSRSTRACGFGPILHFGTLKKLRSVHPSATICGSAVNRISHHVTIALFKEWPLSKRPVIYSPTHFSRKSMAHFSSIYDCRNAALAPVNIRREHPSNSQKLPIELLVPLEARAPVQPKRIIQNDKIAYGDR